MNLNVPVIKCLLFDLGGVVIDVDFHRVFSAWAGTADVNVADLQSKFAFDEAYERHERGEISQVGYFDHLRTKLSIDLDDADFELGWNSIFGDEIRGMHELLRKAGQRFKLFAFTNTNACHQRYWQSQYRDVLRNFTQVFVSSQLGVRKPEPLAFATVCNHMGVAPESVLFFDDSELNVRGAIGSGLQGVRVCNISDVARALDALGIDAFGFPRETS